MDALSRKSRLTEETEVFSKFLATRLAFTTYYSWWTLANRRRLLSMAHNVLQTEQGRHVFAPVPERIVTRDFQDFSLTQFEPSSI
jgi:hypothetical protein